LFSAIKKVVNYKENEVKTKEGVRDEVSELLKKLEKPMIKKYSDWSLFWNSQGEYEIRLEIYQKSRKYLDSLLKINNLGSTHLKEREQPDPLVKVLYKSKSDTNFARFINKPNPNELKKK
jgi:hypothetical protein